MNANLSISHVFGRAWQAFKAQPTLLLGGFLGIFVFSFVLILGLLMVVALCMGASIGVGQLLGLFSGGAAAQSIPPQLLMGAPPFTCIAAGVVYMIAMIVVINLLSLGMIKVGLSAARHGSADFEDIKRPFMRLGPVVGVVLLETLIFMGVMGLTAALAAILAPIGLGIAAPILGLISFVVMVVLMIGLAPAMLLVLEYEEFSITDNLRASWALTKGSKGKLFLLWVLVALLSIPFNLIPYGIGALLYSPYAVCVFAVAYDELVLAVKEE